MKDDGGAVPIVEAAFVFPIMFIALMILIYMGNAFYIKSQIEAIVSQKAIEGAAYCADPILETIKKNEKIPAVNQIDVKPYRYIFGGMNDIENNIGYEVAEEIENGTVSLLGNTMKPEVKSSKSKIAKYNNYVLYATFSVDVECGVKFPIRFFGSKTPYLITIKSHSEIAVNDTAEFIRNTDMVIDYFEENKLVKKIKGIFDKINTFIESFASK